MRMFKRQINPIFVEEEQEYNWNEKRGLGTRLTILFLLLSVIALLAFIGMQL
ncbi:hypothetical protein [Pseudohongiella spirulinae]|uniref:Uncharacterized protein n=1 Tax=Pseudohongiella spirulinae TaxID=1249552 RepID=A0A0S2K9V6_9GAMM|nr:hypothetical protein [Pseudohongiella spirulinae]ALO44862.1 hypothetical protein PS2015_167 [Pseudohongiella spirulinae]